MGSNLAEDRFERGLMTSEEVTEYAKDSHIVPGTILWSADVDLFEDSFRSGSKNAASVDFLRWIDIGVDDKEGRIPGEDLDSHTISKGQGISMFIKKIIPKSMTWISTGPVTKGQKKNYKQDYNPLREQHWWKLEKGQPIPAGLILIYDGVPPGHCTLTVEREMTVRGFLELVSLLKFTSAGSDLFGRKI